MKLYSEMQLPSIETTSQLVTSSSREHSSFLNA
jgi:hypothetical protein